MFNNRANKTDTSFVVVQSKTMRQILVATLLLTASLALVTPTANAERVELLTDNAGDGAYVINSAAGATDGPARPTADLLSLAVEESDEDIIFVLAVTALSEDNLLLSASSSHNIHFTFEGRAHRLNLGYYKYEQEEGSWAYLAAETAGDEDYVADLSDSVIADTSANTLTVTLPKVYVRSTRDATPTTGTSFDNVFVEADGGGIYLTNALTVRGYDRMPDDGSGSFALKLGDLVQGDLMLRTPQKVRVSNGGATTFVYELFVRNTADVARDFDLAASQVPDGWDVRIQSPVTVPAGEERRVPVLASIPFAHEHGGQDTFIVDVEAAREAATHGSMRFGVLHTPIPQPTGHHSQLWLHGYEYGGILKDLGPLFNGGYGWMNAEATLPEDAPTLPPNGNSFGGDEQTYRWYIPLNPRLSVGLDFDIAQTAQLVLGMAGDMAYDGQVRADLWYYRDESAGGESVLLAEGQASPVAHAGGQSTAVDLTLTPTTESDYIAYARETYMTLVVELTTPNAVPLSGGLTGLAYTPLLTTADFELTLPLEEYHDRLSGASEATDLIAIRADGPVQKIATPGSLMTYTFNVTNAGASEATYVIDLAGADDERGEVTPRGATTIGAGESKRVVVAVSVPSSAADGEVFEVLLFVRAQNDPTQMAIARTMTEAGRGGDATSDDESAVFAAAQQANAETPGAGVVGALFALLAGAAVVGAQRRRR